MGWWLKPWVKILRTGGTIPDCDALDTVHKLLKGQGQATNSQPGAWRVAGACNVYPQGQQAHIPHGSSRASSGHCVLANRCGSCRKTHD